jgi:imidazolonepropionase-like amidohydrolase
VVGGRITYDEPTGTATDVQTLDGWVLPGLVDAHCHIGLGPKGAVDDATSEQHALADRAAGALLLRDAGSPVDTRWVQEREDLPRLVRAGRHLARPKRYLRGFAHEIEPEQLASYVVNEARSGDGWVKLVGDWIDREAGDLTPCWPRWALDTAIAAAHDNGARVTAHCFGEESIQDLVEAGIDCIEHGTGLTAETMPLLAQRGVPIVPTLVNIANFPAIADEGEKRFPAYAERMRRLYERRHETVAHAHDAGIPVFVGTSLDHYDPPQPNTDAPWRSYTNLADATQRSQYLDALKNYIFPGMSDPGIDFDARFTVIPSVVPATARCVLADASGESSAGFATGQRRPVIISW